MMKNILWLSAACAAVLGFGACSSQPRNNDTIAGAPPQIGEAAGAENVAQPEPQAAPSQMAPSVSTNAPVIAPNPQVPSGNAPNQ